MLTMVARALDDEQERDLVARYEAGASAADLADEFGVSTYVVLSAVRRAGGTVRRRGAARKDGTRGPGADELAGGEWVRHGLVYRFHPDAVIW